MAKATKISASERRLKFIEHLIDLGWKPNHEYTGSLKDNEVDFEKLIIGKLGKDCHLISPCENYTIRVKPVYATFWQKSPRWIKILNAPIKDIALTEEGVQFGIVNIIIQK